MEDYIDELLERLREWNEPLDDEPCDDGFDMQRRHPETPGCGNPRPARRTCPGFRGTSLPDHRTGV